MISQQTKINPLQASALQQFQRPTSHQYGGLGKVGLAIASGLMQKNLMEGRKVKQLESAESLLNLFGQQQGGDGKTVPPGQFDFSTMTPQALVSAMDDPIMSKVVGAQMQNLMTPKPSILAPQDAEAAGFRPDTVVQRGADGGLSVVQQPKDTSVQDALAQLTIEEKRTQNEIRKENREKSRIADDIASQGKLADAVAGIEGVDALLKDETYKSLFGTFELLDPSNLVSASHQDALAIRDQVVGLLTLESRQKLKGQGTITDQEARTLERSATLLANNRISEKKAKQELQRVWGIFSRARERSVTLPKGVSWADIETTARANGMSQIAVLEELQRRTSGP